MPGAVLYRKWRPQTFEEVVGQEHVTRTLRNAIAMGRIGHAYLFSGPRGTGKTTTARLLAKAVNCLAEEPAGRPCNRCDVCRAINEGRLLDLIEIDAASHTGVDDVRELRDKIAFRPNECRYKVYIIDEVHRFSGSAFDALLKTIEEPPPHAIFVLATTEIHKVPATIRSRCQQFDFRRIPVEQIVERLQRIVQEEGLRAEPEALRFIARQATGSLRDAISLLDQLAAYNAGEITLAQAQAVLGAGTLETVLQLTDRLAAGDVAGGLNLINEAVDRGVDPRQLTRQLVEHLRGVLLLRLDGADLLDLPQEMRRPMADQAGRFPVRRLLRAIRRFSRAEGNFRGGWHPQLPLEMAFVESCLDEEAVSPADGAPAAASRSPAASGPASRPSPPSSSSPLPSEAPAGGQAATPPATGTTSVPKGTARRPTRRPTSLPARPSPPKAPTGRPTTGVSPGELTLALVQERWRGLLRVMRSRDRSVEALLRSAHPIAVEGETVVLRADHEFARSKLQVPRTKALVEEVLEHVTGHRCHVRYVLKGQSAQAGEAPGEAGSSDLDGDPLLQEAVEKLGAQVRPFNQGG